MNNLISQEIENGFGLHVQLNAPELFKRKDFLDYIETRPVFTWHRSGTKPDEYADVAVLVEPNLSGEGDCSDMPTDIWDAIIDTLKSKFGEKGEKVPGFARDRHIVVRLTNMEI